MTCAGENPSSASQAEMTNSVISPALRSQQSARRHWTTWTSLMVALIVGFIAITGIPLNVFWPAPTIPEANVIDIHKPRQPFSSVPLLEFDFPGAASDKKKAGRVGVLLKLSSGYHSDRGGQVIDPSTLYLILDTTINEKPFVNEKIDNGKKTHLQHAFGNVHEGGTYIYGPITVKILKFWKPPYPWYETPWGPYATDYYQVTFDESKIAWPADPASWPESRTD